MSDYERQITARLYRLGVQRVQIVNAGGRHHRRIEVEVAGQVIACPVSTTPSDAVRGVLNEITRIKRTVLRRTGIRLGSRQLS